MRDVKRGEAPPYPEVTLVPVPPDPSPPPPSPPPELSPEAWVPKKKFTVN